MNWSFDTDRPIYFQLVEGITHAIAGGEFQAGEKLPSVRDMAAEASVNPNTMQRALSELERAGLVYTQRTAGRFITEDIKMLNKVKQDLIKEQIEKFFTQMKNMGVSKEEILKYIEEANI